MPCSSRCASSTRTRLQLQPHHALSPFFVFFYRCAPAHCSFQPSDLVTKANEIYDVYMGPNAAVKVNVADRVVKDVEKQMKENNITNFLFVNAQKDIVRAQRHHNLRVCILSTAMHVSDRCGMHCCGCCRCTCSSRISSRATRSGAIRRVSSSRRAPRGTRSACWIARGSAIGRR